MSANPTSFSTPRYVLVAGSLGVFIALALFHFQYPSPGDAAGQVFVSTSEFGVWVFLQTIHLCVLSIALLPLWSMFLRSFRAQTQSAPEKSRVRAIVLGQAVLLTGLIFFVLWFLSVTRTQLFAPSLHTPRGIEENLKTGFATLLPFAASLLANLLGFSL